MDEVLSLAACAISRGAVNAEELRGTGERAGLCNGRLNGGAGDRLVRPGAVSFQERCSASLTIGHDICLSDSDRCWVARLGHEVFHVYQYEQQGAIVCMTHGLIEQAAYLRGRGIDAYDGKYLGRTNEAAAEQYEKALDQNAKYC